MLEKTRNFIKNVMAPSGVVIQDGFVNWDGHNKRWATREFRLEDIRNMLRDPIIKGMLRAWTLPILNAGGRIEPASDSPEDLKVAEFLEDVFWGGKTSFGFRDFLNDLFRFNEFGFRVMVKRVEPVENKLYWKKFTGLQPETIERWFTDEDFNIKSIKQELAFNSNTQTYEDHLIDIKSVFYIANDVEGSNFEGESILAPVYGAWWRKDKFLRMKSIQAERGSIGIPRGKISRSATPSEKDQLKNVLKNLRGSHEEGYAMESEGAFEIGFIGGKDFFGIDLRPFIADENREMVEAINAGFLQQSKGDTSTGSFAKQDADIDFFKMGVSSQQEFIDSVINDGYLGTISLIKQLVDLNFNVTEYPKYVSNDAYQDDIEVLVKSAQMGKQSGFLTVTNEDEVYIRSRLGLPEVELPEERPVQVPVNQPLTNDPTNSDPAKAETPANDTTVKNIAFAEIKKRGKKVTPALLQLEKKIDIEGMRDELDRREFEAQKELDVFLKDTRDQMLRTAQRILVKKKSITDVQAAIESYSIPNQVKMSVTLTKHARDMFVYGRARVKAEKGVNAFADILDDMRQARKALKPTIEITMANFHNKLKLEWSDVILAQFKTGVIDTLAIQDRLERVSDKKFKVEVNKKLQEAFGSGRNGQLKAQGVEKVIRSEVLDSNTCAPCIAIDGEVIVVDSARWAEVSRGVFSGCLGGDSCRGINIEWNE